MKKKLNIVLSCTSRKRNVGRRVLCLREIGGTDVGARARAWAAALADVPPVSEAREIYAGEYWRAAIGLAEQAESSFDVAVWVVSAGLGLIAAQDRIPPYSATFVVGHPDSVVSAAGTGGLVRRRWWASLSEWCGPTTDSRPRSLGALAASAPEAGMLVCVGPDYLDAVRDDLRDARNALGCASQLVICGSASPGGVLDESWVHVPGRLRTSLGGSMASTTPRAAKIAIASQGAGTTLDAGVFRRVVKRLVASSEDLPRFDRQGLDDAEVSEWIRRYLVGNPQAMKSAALREYRTSGFACEQSRFGRLFADVKELGG